MVWREDGSAPTKKHFDKASATREAERLARGYPSTSFFVLEGVSCSSKVDVTTVKLEEIECPF
jgi:hypothetical protein